MDDIEVEPFRPEHADGISALAKAEGWPTFSDPDRVRRLFTAPGAIGMVAVGPGGVLGAGHLLTDGHHGYLTFLAVDSGARRSGIGSRLIEAIFAATGIVRMDLLATSDASAFYRSLPNQEFMGFRLYPRSAASEQGRSNGEPVPAAE